MRVGAVAAELGSGIIGHCGLLMVQEQATAGEALTCVWSKQAMTSLFVTATPAWQWARSALERSTLAAGDADANPLAGDEALPARATTWPGAASAAEPAAAPRYRFETDSRLRAGRVRQVQVARRVAGGSVVIGRRDVRCVAGTRLR